MLTWRFHSTSHQISTNEEDSPSDWYTVYTGTWPGPVSRLHWGLGQFVTSSVEGNGRTPCHTVVVWASRRHREAPNKGGLQGKLLVKCKRPCRRKVTPAQPVPTWNFIFLEPRPQSLANSQWLTIFQASMTVFHEKRKLLCL